LFGWIPFPTPNPNLLLDMVEYWSHISTGNALRTAQPPPLVSFKLVLETMDFSIEYPVTVNWRNGTGLSKLGSSSVGPSTFPGTRSGNPTARTLAR
jgi:hypothetical protein